MRAILERLIAARTHNPGGDEPALARLCAGLLSERGAEAVDVVEVSRPGPAGEETGAWVLARWGTPRLLVNAHLDTVPVNAGWRGDPFRLRAEGGRFYGLGTCDTKGAIAAVLSALEASSPRDVAVLFSGDEERTGSCMRACLAAFHLRGISRAVVCEPTGGRVGVRHRGVLAIELALKGAGGHSSRADEMPAPIADLARVATAIADWGVRMREVGPLGFRGMCTNVAALDGGIAFNVVPDRAQLSVSVRPPPGSDVAAVRDELYAIADAIVPGLVHRAPVENPPFATREPAAFRPLLGAAANEPIDLAFWTEAAILSHAGIDAVVYGPGDIAQAHAPDEFVEEAQLEAARETFAGLFRGSRDGIG